MDYFDYQSSHLHAESLAVSELAESFGTPLYVYSKATIERHWHAFNDAAGNFPHLVCYAVKANSNLAILQLLARLGSGFDIVSGGELARVLQAGGDPRKIVFSGVGKTVREIEFALEVGIKCFNVESEAELLRIQQVASNLGLIAPVSVRVNPDIDAGTHPYISTGLKENKFGIDFRDAPDVYRRAAAMSHIAIKGVDCHIGSQLTDIEPFKAALTRLLALIDSLADEGIVIEHLDVGGGLGVTYDDEVPPAPDSYVAELVAMIGERSLSLIFEPGRAIMANAGILVTRVEYLKQTPHKQFAIVDAAMNDLLRPSLYQAWQKIIPVEQKNGESINYDIVGPVCETGDFLGKNRELVIEQGDLLVVRSAGAYGFTMASNYNSRCLPAEVLVDENEAFLIGKRQTTEDLWQREVKLP